MVAVVVVVEEVAVVVVEEVVVVVVEVEVEVVVVPKQFELEARVLGQQVAEPAELGVEQP